MLQIVLTLTECHSDLPACVQEHCCFVDVHGLVVTQPKDLEKAVRKAASCTNKAAGSCNSTQLQEADHVYNPDKLGATGGDSSQLGKTCCAGP